MSSRFLIEKEEPPPKRNINHLITSASYDATNHKIVLYKHDTTTQDLNISTLNDHASSITTLEDAGYQTSSQVDANITARGFQTNSQVDANITASTAHLIKNVSFSSTNRELLITKEDDSPQDPIPLNFIEPGSHLDNSISNLNKYATTAESDSSYITNVQLKPTDTTKLQVTKGSSTFEITLPGESAFEEDGYVEQFGGVSGLRGTGGNNGTVTGNFKLWNESGATIAQSLLTNSLSMPAPPAVAVVAQLSSVTLDYTNLSDSWFQFFEFQIWTTDNTNVLSGIFPTLYPTQHTTLTYATDSIINSNSRPSINSSYLNQNGEKKVVYNLSGVNLEDLACCVIFARNNEEHRLHNVKIRFDANDGTHRETTLTSYKNNNNSLAHKIKFGTELSNSDVYRPDPNGNASGGYSGVVNKPIADVFYPWNLGYTNREQPRNTAIYNQLNWYVAPTPKSGTNEFLLLQFPNNEAETITMYRAWFVNPATFDDHPNNFTLKASNDGTTFITLQEATNTPSWVNASSDSDIANGINCKEFSVPTFNQADYKYYKLEMSTGDAVIPVRLHALCFYSGSLSSFNTQQLNPLNLFSNGSYNSTTKQLNLTAFGSGAVTNIQFPNYLVNADLSSYFNGASLVNNNLILTSEDANLTFPLRDSYVKSETDVFINNLQSTINTQILRINVLETDVAQLQASVSTLNTQNTTQNINLGNINSQVITLTNLVNSLGGSSGGGGGGWNPFG